MAKKQNHIQVTEPCFSSDGFVEGWFKLTDGYRDPEVLYGSWPPVTTIKIGGRNIEIDRPVTVFCQLLEPEEDRRWWSRKPQHQKRVNLGHYHPDFGDVEVAFSFSAPQTHVWINGYMLHFLCFETLSVYSYNARVLIRPEKVLDGLPGRSASVSPADNRDYHLALPSINEKIGRPKVEYKGTSVHYNDCIHDFRVVDDRAVGARIGVKASPSDLPPVPPLERPRHPSQDTVHIPVPLPPTPALEPQSTPPLALPRAAPNSPTPSSARRRSVSIYGFRGSN